MTKSEFIQDGYIKMIHFKAILGEDFERVMSAVSVDIIDYQYTYGCHITMISAAMIMCANHKDPSYTDRIKAAVIWYECNKIFMLPEIYNITWQ